MEPNSETIKIFFDGETESKYKLPDISYEKFGDLMFESGSSDIEYEKYLIENNMKELSDFNSQSTPEITLVLEAPYRGRVLKFRCIYDSENDDDFDEFEYFKKELYEKEYEQYVKSITDYHQDEPILTYEQWIKFQK